MFDCSNAFKYLQVAATHPVEIASLLCNLKQYGVILTVPELLQMGWRGSLKTLISRLQVKYSNDFDSMLEKERLNIIKAMSLVEKCGFDDYNPQNVIECLRECGVEGEKYRQVVYAGFQ